MKKEIQKGSRYPGEYVARGINGRYFQIKNRNLLAELYFSTVFVYESGIEKKLKHGLFLLDFGHFGVVEKLGFRAFQRHWNQQNPLRFAPLHGPFLIGP